MKAPIIPVKTCVHCGQVPEGKWWVHEQECGENPDNLPDMTAMHSCGHQGSHKPFNSSPEGIAQRAAFEAGRLCSSCVIAQYRKAQANRTPEQIAEHQYELRAAFGPGETVVNMLTGETTTT